MKKKILGIATVAIMVSAAYAGGGKNMVPAVTPIAAIETINPSPWYLGAGLVWGSFVYDECPNAVECNYEDITYGLMIRGGYEFNEYFGIEARGIRTFWDEGENGGERLQHVGLFAKPMYPVSEHVNVYALAGYGWTKTITGGNGNLPTIDESGFSWGVGLEYDLSDREADREEGEYDRPFDGYADQERGWGLFIDYQRLLVDSNMPDMDVVSVGVTYDF